MFNYMDKLTSYCTVCPMSIVIQLSKVYFVLKNEIPRNQKVGKFVKLSGGATAQVERARNRSRCIQNGIAQYTCTLHFCNLLSELRISLPYWLSNKKGTVSLLRGFMVGYIFSDKLTIL